MKFNLKKSSPCARGLKASALVSLALVAGTASAGNLCYLGLPGMGCSNVASGGADSTGQAQVGPQPLVGTPSWMPPTQDGLTQALVAYDNGTLPAAPYSVSPYLNAAGGHNKTLDPGWDDIMFLGDYYDPTILTIPFPIELAYNPSTGQYAYYKVYGIYL